MSILISSFIFDLLFFLDAPSFLQLNPRESSQDLGMARRGEAVCLPSTVVYCLIGPAESKSNKLRTGPDMNSLSRALRSVATLPVVTAPSRPRAPWLFVRCHAVFYMHCMQPPCPLGVVRLPSHVRATQPPALSLPPSALPPGLSLPPPTRRLQQALVGDANRRLFASNKRILLVQDEGCRRAGGPPTVCRTVQCRAGPPRVAGWSARASDSMPARAQKPWSFHADNLRRHPRRTGAHQSRGGRLHAVPRGVKASRPGPAAAVDRDRRPSWNPAGRRRQSASVWRRAGSQRPRQGAGGPLGRPGPD